MDLFCLLLLTYLFVQVKGPDRYQQLERHGPRTSVRAGGTQGAHCRKQGVFRAGGLRVGKGGMGRIVAGRVLGEVCTVVPPELVGICSRLSQR